MKKKEVMKLYSPTQLRVHQSQYMPPLLKELNKSKECSLSYSCDEMMKEHDSEHDDDYTSCEKVDTKLSWRLSQYSLSY